MPLQFHQLHFLNDTINTDPCHNFRLFSNVIQKEDGYYLLSDTVQIDLDRKSKEEDWACFFKFSGLDRYFPRKIATQDIQNQCLFVEGEIELPNVFYKKYKKQIKKLPKILNKKLLSEKPYLYIANFFSKRQYRKTGCWEYAMQIGDNNAKIWFWLPMRYSCYLEVNYLDAFK